MRDYNTEGMTRERKREREVGGWRLEEEGRGLVE